MARIKMLRTEKGCLASDPGQVVTFAEGKVYEVDDELAEAFALHMRAAETTEEAVTIEQELEPEARPLMANPAPVMDLAAMAAQVADMLKGQFAADIASIGERLEFIEANVQRVDRLVEDLRVADLGDQIDKTGEAHKILAGDVSKIRADLDALRSEFDEALEEDATGDASKTTTAKPKGSK